MQVRKRPSKLGTGVGVARFSVSPRPSWPVVPAPAPQTTVLTCSESETITHRHSANADLEQRASNPPRLPEFTTSSVFGNLESFSLIPKAEAETVDNQAVKGAHRHARARSEVHLPEPPRPEEFDISAQAEALRERRDDKLHAFTEGLGDAIRTG